VTVPLARCTEPGCPWRWTTGGDRTCGQHDTDDTSLTERAAEYGVILSAAPDGDREHAMDGSNAVSHWQ